MCTSLTSRWRTVEHRNRVGEQQHYSMRQPCAYPVQDCTQHTETGQNPSPPTNQPLGDLRRALRGSSFHTFALSYLSCTRGVDVGDWQRDCACHARMNTIGHGAGPPRVQAQVRCPGSRSSQRLPFSLSVSLSLSLILYFFSLFRSCFHCRVAPCPVQCSFHSSLTAPLP